jgi:hypothetical protein
MRILVNYLFLGIALASPVLIQNTQTGDPAIYSPRPGDVLQGVIPITGTSDITGFFSTEVSFTYADDPTGTWFLINLTTQPVTNDKLATWDTTVITDGNYLLRLHVTLEDGSIRETIVSGLRVRNYTLIETSTPTPVAPTATVPTAVMPTAVAPTATPLPTITLTPTPFPTPTSLPSNPATLAPADVYRSVLYGAVSVILAFFLFGTYLWLRRK